MQKNFPTTFLRKENAFKKEREGDVKKTEVTLVPSATWDFYSKSKHAFSRTGQTYIMRSHLV